MDIVHFCFFHFFKVYHVRVNNNAQIILLFKFESGFMSDSKWKQIEENLAEQESFVQTIIQQRQKRNRPQNNANLDNVLSLSIKKAKDKINSIECKPANRSYDNLANSRQKKQKNNEESCVGIAGAMKKLQNKIQQLQVEKKKLLTDLNEEREKLVNLQKKLNEQSRQFEESRRKVKNLQVTIFNDKGWIKQLEKKIQKFEKQLYITNNNNQAKEQNSTTLSTKLSNESIMLKAQQQELENTLLENQTKQKQIENLNLLLQQNKQKFTEEIEFNKSLQKELEIKVSSLNERIKQKDHIIEGLKEQIKKVEVDRLKFSRALLEEPKEEQNHVACDRIRLVKEDFQDLTLKYQQLIQSYHFLEERGKKDKIDAKNYRNKFWQLKEVMKDIIQKINYLPNAATAQLRYLITKANKIQIFENEYFMNTPKKTSMVHSHTERSKSKSKSKNKSSLLKMEDLNQSNHSARSKRSVKGRSDSMKSQKSVKKRSTSKQKKIVISEKSMKSVKNDERSKLERQIQSIRNKFKELVSLQSNGQEVGEEIREELNDLATLLQEKSEQLTKIKKRA